MISAHAVSGFSQTSSLVSLPLIDIAGAGGMSGFEWDLGDEAGRKLYFWPREAVLASRAQGWDLARLDETLARLDKEHERALLRASPAAASLFEGPQSDLELRLEKALDGQWVIEFAAGRTGRLCVGDRFYLPLIDPATGRLSPKHPAYHEQLPAIKPGAAAASAEARCCDLSSTLMPLDFARLRAISKSRRKRDTMRSAFKRSPL
ncbi:MAG: hypothetical protein AAGL49_03710 [Pseudomonadota bacterium]